MIPAHQINTVVNLQSLYGTPDEMDLWVGIVAERGV